MMLLEPSQKNVATTASPWCGFVVNAAANEFPLSPSEPLGAVPPLAATSNRGAPGPPRSGPTESLHAAARSAAPRILGRLADRPRTGLTLIAGVGRYSSNTETTFESEPDAPAASATVAVIVK